MDIVFAIDVSEEGEQQGPGLRFILRSVVQRILSNLAFTSQVRDQRQNQGRRQGWGPGGPDPPPPKVGRRGGSGGPVQRQEEGGAKSVPKLQIKGPSYTFFSRFARIIPLRSQQFC